MNDIYEPPSRGGQPRYLDRALTQAERQRLYRARKQGRVSTLVPPKNEAAVLISHGIENLQLLIAMRGELMVSPYAQSALAIFERLGKLL